MINSDLIKELRNMLGDTDPEDPNISDIEMSTLLRNAAAGYSRMKSIPKRILIPFISGEDYYELPEDSYKVKKVELIEQNLFLKFEDNLNHIILEEFPDVNEGTLRITYSQYFSPDEIDERELDIYLLYAEALAYKHMASKSADWVKFSSGEKMVDESLVSSKFLELFEATQKEVKRKIIKAYGKRGQNMIVDLDYNLPYPVKGENP